MGRKRLADLRSAAALAAPGFPLAAAILRSSARAASVCPICSSRSARRQARSIASGFLGYFCINSAAAWADMVGADEYLPKIKDGWTDVDVIIATPDMMGEIGKLGRILGPRGLMPNPKVGTVTMDVAKATITEIEPTLNAATSAFQTAETTIDNVDAFVQTRVPEIADDLTSAITTIEAATNEFRTQFDTVLSQFGGSAELASKRLVELEVTIATLDATLAEARSSLAAVESASVNFQGLVDGEGTALVADARTTLRNVQDAISGLDQVFQQDVPTIVADIRTAVTTATDVIDRVSTDITSFTERLEPLADSSGETLKAATETLQNANRTLSNLDQALAKAETTLDAAERTFVDADTALTNDLGPALSDVRTAASQFETTMATLSRDIPDITGDLREALARSLSVIQKIDDTVTAGAPPFQTFARTGLPEFTKFARESQQLVLQLEKLAKKMERDPARFFFGNRIPEFRR